MDYVFPYVVTGGWSIVDIETKNANVPSYRVAININKNYVEGFQVQVWCNGKHATIEHASPKDMPVSPVELFTVTDELAMFYCGTDASYIFGMPVDLPILGFQISRSGSTGTLDNDCWIFALDAGIPEDPTEPWSLGYHVKNNRTGHWLELRRCPDGALLALDAQKSEWADVATTCQYLNGYKASGFFPISTINETPSLLSSLLPNTTILPDSISAAGFGMTTDSTKELSNVPTITTQNSKI